MPRGRAGLLMIAPDVVQDAIARHVRSDFYVAQVFGVTERTVRRWKRTGLPLYYGRANVKPDQWERFQATGRGQVSRDPVKPVRGVDPADRSRPKAVRPIVGTSVDRHLSAPSSPLNIARRSASKSVTRR